MKKTTYIFFNSKKTLDCSKPNLGQIWTNPKVGLKMASKNWTQWLGLSIFDPKLG